MFLKQILNRLEFVSDSIAITLSISEDKKDVLTVRQNCHFPQTPFQIHQATLM